MLRFGYDFDVGSGVLTCDQIATLRGCDGYFCWSGTSIEMVPPSLAWNVLFPILNPFKWTVTVCIPVGTCTRAGVNWPVELPSTMISAPLGVEFTCAQATRAADFSLRGTLSCVWILSLT